MYRIEKTLLKADTFLAKLPYMWLLLIPPVIYAKMNLGFHGDVYMYYVKASELLGLSSPGKIVLEYPILALIPMLAPRILMYNSVDFLLYKNIFIAENALFLFMIYFVLRRILQKFNFTLLHIRLISFIGVAWIFQLLYLRFDLFPTLLSLTAFSFFVKGRYFLSGINLAFAVLAKLYPLVLIYVCSVKLITAKKYKALAWGTAGITVATFVCVQLFMYWQDCSLLSLVKFLSSHQNRGIQIESVPASVAYMHHLLMAFPLEVVHNFGSDNLVYPLSSELLQPLFPVFAITVLWLTIIIWRNESDPFEKTDKVGISRMAAYFVMILGCFIIFNKVFSPQYLIWMLPFVFLLPFEILFLFLIVIVLTSLIYPFLYLALTGLQVHALIIQIVRNSVLTLALFAMFLKYWQKEPRFRLNL